MYNTEVGYCQGEWIEYLSFVYSILAGMSQIAALFLMYRDEEDAFW